MLKILEAFGKLATESVFNPTIKRIETFSIKETVPEIFNYYSSLIQNLSNSEYDTFLQYARDINSSFIFDFLKIFEENNESKMTLTEGTRMIDLNEISEMIKTEHLGEGGWINKFGV